MMIESNIANPAPAGFVFFMRNNGSMLTLSTANIIVADDTAWFVQEIVRECRF
jgi:hypothetical protein